MSSTTAARRPSAEPPPSARLFQLGAQLAFAISILLTLVVLAQTLTGMALLGVAGLAEALLVIMTAIATLTGMARRLPGHKVLLGAAITAVIGGGAHALSKATAIPFGPFTYTDAIGPRFFNGSLAWVMPALWIVVALNARGVARLVLKPWRKTKTYGFWVIGLATLLVVLFDLALEPFATKVTRYWIWLPTKFDLTWHGMPWINSFGWALTAVLLFAFATPFLVNKEARSRKTAPDYQPLIIWVALLTLLGAGAAREQLWSAVALCAATAVGAAIFAIRGARW